MNQTSGILAAFFMIAAFLSCQNDPASAGNVREAATTAAIEENKPDILSSAANEGKIVSMSPEKIMLDNTREILLPPADDKETATIFFVRAAENTKGKSGLTQVGLARAGYLATIMQHVKLSQAYAEGGSDAMQTALMPAKANECELNVFHLENASLTMRTIIGNFKGKRVLVAGSPAVLSKLMGEFLENPKIQVPDGEFDNFFVVMTNGTGKAEVHHLIY